MEVDHKTRSMLELVINQLFLTGSYGSARVPLPVIRTVLTHIINTLKREQTLIEMEGNVTIVGDLHGQMVNLVRALSQGKLNPTAKFVFLGDYVDRGKNSLEVIVLLYALKILYPKNICLLRGNHESKMMSEPNSFYSECCAKAASDIYDEFVRSFNYLPLAAIVNKEIFCVHGGISPNLDSVNQIREIRRPVEIPLSGLITDLLWSDPDPKCLTFGPNARGCTCTWGKISSDRFLIRNRLKMIVRGHQVVEDGYKYPLGDKSVITLCTSWDPTFVFTSKNCVMKIYQRQGGYKFFELNEKTPKISIFSIHAMPTQNKDDSRTNSPKKDEGNMTLTRTSTSDFLAVKKEVRRSPGIRRSNSLKMFV